MKGMTKKIVTWFLCAGIICITAAFVGCSNTKEASNTGKNGIKIASVQNTHKLSLDEEFPQTEGKIKVSLAKGEREGAQLAFQSDKDVAEFEVKTAELKNDAGDSISVDCAQVYFLKYMAVPASEFEIGDYPDAMIPFASAVEKGENKLEANVTQGIWVTFTIPSDQAKGVYTGNYTLVTDGKETSIPVEVEVYDFALPEVPSLKSVYLIWRDWLIDGELESGQEIYTAYYDFLKEYRLDPYEFPSETGDIEGYITDMKKYYDTAATFCIPHTRVEAGTAVYEETTYKTYTIDEEQMVEYLCAIARESSNEKNYFSKAYYYIHDIIDEASANEAKRASIRLVYTSLANAEEQAIQILESEGYFNESNSDIKESIRGLKQIMVGSRLEDYEDIIQLYCPIYDNVNTTQLVEFYQNFSRQEGKELFSYGCIGAVMPYNTYFTEDDLISCRDKSWHEYVCNATGDLYWCVNDYVDLGESFGTQYGRLEEFYTKDADRDAIAENISGDGYLLYPGRPYGLNKPIASLRLEAIRDGSEDYDYMKILEDKYEVISGEAGKMGARSLIEMMTEDINKFFISSYNHDGLANARETIARLIEAAGTANFSIEKVELTDAEMMLVCTVDDGWKVSAGEAKVTATDGQYTITTKRGELLSLKIEKRDECITVNIPVSSGYKLANAFEAQKDLNNYSMTNGSACSLNSNADFAKDGNSLSAVYAGRADESAFRPALRMNVEDMHKIDKIGMSIYNPGSETRVINVVVRTSEGESKIIDTFELAAGQWRDWTYRFNERQLSEKFKKEMVRINFELAENPTENVTLYFDNYMVSNKK